MTAAKEESEGNHDAIDGCMCGVKHEVPATADHELPSPRPKHVEPEKKP